MFPSLSIVTKRVKSSLQIIRFADLATSLMHDSNSGFSDDPVFFRQGFEFVSFNDKFSVASKIFVSDGEDENLSGDLKRWLTLFRPVASFRFSCGLFWIDRMFQKTIESERLNKINGSFGSFHGENWRFIMARLWDSSFWIEDMLMRSTIWWKIRKISPKHFKLQ